MFSKKIDRSSLILYIATYDEGFEDRFERLKNINPPDLVKTVEDEFNYMIRLHAKWRGEALEKTRARFGLNNES